MKNPLAHLVLYWLYNQIHMSCIPYSVLRQAHNIFQSEFYTECDLLLPLSNSSILSFP